jgi:hypothetical protein
MRMSHPLTACISEIGLLEERIREKNARIEQLEAEVVRLNSVIEKMLDADADAARLVLIEQGVIDDSRIIGVIDTALQSSGAAQTSDNTKTYRCPATRQVFEIVIAALNYDGKDIDSLTVSEIRRALP